MKKFTRIVYCIALFAFLSATFSAPATEQTVAGWVERAKLFPANLSIKAKLDTGAKTTSLNAVDLSTFQRDGRLWVLFSLANYRGRNLVIERPVVRFTKIKRHFKKSQVRPVIELDVCIGTIRKMVQVNLVDRSRLNYQLLVGRNFLKPELLVDSGRTFVLNTDCSKPVAEKAQSPLG